MAKEYVRYTSPFQVGAGARLYRPMRITRKRFEYRLYQMHWLYDEPESDGDGRGDDDKGGLSFQSWKVWAEVHLAPLGAVSVTGL